MDLKAGHPYFLIKNGLNQVFSKLEEDHVTDVVILGGGISGALMAHELIKHNIQCTVIDGRSIGFGSTSSSTALLQYEIDVPLHQLSQKIGLKNATQAYHLCGESINTLKNICKEINYKDFMDCNSVYFLHSMRSLSFIKKEFDARRRAGFDVELLSKGDIIKQFGLHAGLAILSSQAAKIDPYSFTQALHSYNLNKGLKLFEDTYVKSIKHSVKGVVLKTDRGHAITAKKIIHATGYEAVEQIKKPIVKLTSTYAIASKRISHLPGFFQNTLFWNTANPYVYMREDKDRVIIGGRDELFYNPVKRDKLLPLKSKKLQEDFKKLYPHIPFETQFFWTGTFGSTTDGLPYIGLYDQFPNSYFALGFGGNGITFSVIAAELIAKSIKSKSYSVPQMFGFNR